MSAGGESRQPDLPPSPITATYGDADLLGRLAAGERADALDELCARYAPPLYDLGLTLFGGPEPAGRLAAETIGAVAARAREFDPGGGSRSAREFVFGVARERAAELTPEDPDAAVAIPGDTDFELALAGVEFRAAVAALGEEGRGVVEAVLGEGLTRAEAGERLGLTVGIVEVRLRTALRAVRDELDARGVAAVGRR